MNLTATRLVWISPLLMAQLASTGSIPIVMQYLERRYLHNLLHIMAHIVNDKMCMTHYSTQTRTLGAKVKGIIIITQQ